MKELNIPKGIPKEEFPIFLEEVIMSELKKLNVSGKNLEIYTAKKGDHKTPNGYFIIENKTKMPLVQLFMDGTLKFNLPGKYHFLGYENHWTKLFDNYKEGKSH